MRTTWKQWLKGIGDIILINRNIKKRLFKLAILMVKFWWKFTCKMRLKRKRRLLAEVLKNASSHLCFIIIFNILHDD
jgi:hypothetical protein